MGALTSLLLYPFLKGYNILGLSEYQVWGKELRDRAREQAGPSEVCTPFPSHRFRVLRAARRPLPLLHLLWAPNGLGRQSSKPPSPQLQLPASLCHLLNSRGA